MILVRLPHIILSQNAATACTAHLLERCHAADDRVGRVMSRVDSEGFREWLLTRFNFARSWPWPRCLSACHAKLLQTRGAADNLMRFETPHTANYRLRSREPPITVFRSY